jgi:hypothetical protein
MRALGRLEAIVAAQPVRSSIRAVKLDHRAADFLSRSLTAARARRSDALRAAVQDVFGWFDAVGTKDGTHRPCGKANARTRRGS